MTERPSAYGDKRPVARLPRWQPTPLPLGRLPPLNVRGRRLACAAAGPPRPPLFDHRCPALVQPLGEGEQRGRGDRPGHKGGVQRERAPAAATVDGSCGSSLSPHGRKSRLGERPHFVRAAAHHRRSRLRRTPRERVGAAPGRMVTRRARPARVGGSRACG